MVDESEDLKKHQQPDNTLSECGVPGCKATEIYVGRDKNGDIIPVCAEHWENHAHTEVEYDGFV